MQNRLYVGNLAAEATASGVQELFEPHGYVTDVKLVQGAKVPGFAFVIMATDESALTAMKALNGTSWHGVMMRVEAAGDEAVLGSGGRS